MSDYIQEVVDKITELRAHAGVGPVKRDSRLEKSAQVHVDGLMNGAMRPHDQLEQRIRDCGFPHQECGTRSGFSNFSEGVSFGFGGFSPTQLVEILNDNGAHGRDFRDPVFNVVGVAYKSDGQKSFLVVEYGALCQEDPMAKPSENDFGAF